MLSPNSSDSGGAIFKNPHLMSASAAVFFLVFLGGGFDGSFRAFGCGTCER